jgi:hypothetical protein
MFVEPVEDKAGPPAPPAPLVAGGAALVPFAPAAPTVWARAVPPPVQQTTGVITAIAVADKINLGHMPDIEADAQLFAAFIFAPSIGGRRYVRLPLCRGQNRDLPVSAIRVTSL